MSKRSVLLKRIHTSSINSSFTLANSAFHWKKYYTAKLRCKPSDCCFALQCLINLNVVSDQQISENDEEYIYF